MALSGVLRWGPRHRRTRAVLLPLGLNLAAGALVGAILAAGSEPGGLGVLWVGWLWSGGLARRMIKLTGRESMALKSMGTEVMPIAMQSLLKPEVRP